MDILYILGKGSPFNNEELRYSLRSLERFGQNIGRVVLVGEKPNFLDYTKIEHHPFKESGVKDYRIAAKIMHACAIGAVSGDFLFCNDDFFFTKQFDCARFPYYQKGALYTGTNASAYGDHLKLTRDYLLQQGKPTRHYDVHCPIIYNAEKFMALADAWEYSKSTIGMVVKSIYGNMYEKYILGSSYVDVKLKSLLNNDDYRMMHLNECFSIYDQAWNRGVKEYLQNTFTIKSQWEL